MRGISLLDWFVNRHPRVHPGDPETSRLAFPVAARSFPAGGAIGAGRFFSAARVAPTS
jgi:hypothetical protein